MGGGGEGEGVDAPTPALADGLLTSGALYCFEDAPIVCPEESPPAFLPEYLYPVGFFANYGPKVSKGRAESPLVRPQAHTPAPGGA